MTLFTNFRTINNIMRLLEILESMELKKKFFLKGNHVAKTKVATSVRARVCVCFAGCLVENSSISWRRRSLSVKKRPRSLLNRS